MALAVALLSAGSAQAQNTAPFQIVEASIDDIHVAYRSGRLTAHQLMQAYLDRIEAYDKQARTSTRSSPSIRTRSRMPTGSTRRTGQVRSRRPAARHPDPGEGRDRHRRHADDARHGRVQGLPAAAGCLRRRASCARRARSFSARRRSANLPRGDTYGSMFGVTRNPYDLERTVGGSSGGSGAALAANFSTVALGEETLASIRRPGGWNAVVSMRPTPGLVSRSGMWDGYPTVRRRWADGADRARPREAAGRAWWATIRKIR